MSDVCQECNGEGWVPYLGDDIDRMCGACRGSGTTEPTPEIDWDELAARRKDDMRDEA